MKTLFSYTFHIYLFYECTCILGFVQLHPKPKLSTLSVGDNTHKKCQGVNGNIRTSNYLDQDVLLCFGLKVFSQHFRDKVEASAFFGGVEKKSDTEICKHFQEMRLNSTMEKQNGSVEVYNRQFRDETTCERACLDVMNNVNPLCSIILLLSRHSKGNSNGSGSQPLSTTQRGDKADNNNEVSNVNQVHEKSIKVMEVSNTIPDEQQPKATDVERVPDEEKTEVSDHEQKSKAQKLVLNDGEDKAHLQNTEVTLPEKSPQGIISTLANEGKLLGQQQQTGGTIIDSDKRKPNATSQEKALVSEKAKEEAVATGVQEVKDRITANINTDNDTLNKTASSNKEQKVTTAESINSVTKNENQGKSTSLTKENILKHSYVIIPKSSGDNKIELAASTRPKLQENFSAGEDDLASKKVVAETVPSIEESISQVINVEEGKAIDNSQKSQAENPPLQNVEIQVNSKTVTEEIPESDIDEQKTTQKKGKSYKNEDAEVVSQSGRDDTQKTVIEEIHFADDTGDGLAELDTHNSIADKNDMDAGPVVFHEKYDDDDSHFFAYFMTTMVFCIVGYLVFHNKQKILALALEGRARRGRRRPNTSGYRKLDSNLEEAISSSKSASVTQVIY